MIDNNRDMAYWLKRARNVEVHNYDGIRLGVTIWTETKEEIVADFEIYDGGAIRFSGCAAKKIGYAKIWQIIRVLTL